MRTIVAFVLTAVWAVALHGQPPRPAEQIERLEKRVADGHSVVSERVTLVNLYFQQRNVEGRRRHVLWLIENHPEINELRSPNESLDRSAPQPDAAGFAQATRLWRDQAAKPDLSPKAIANGAFFFRFVDRATAKSLLDAGSRDHPGDPDIARMRGMFDAILIGGVTAMGPGPAVTNAELAHSPDAVKARAEVESSRDAKLIGGAAAFVSQQSYLFNQVNSAPIFGDEDALAVAERWLSRAREIEPAADEWKNLLANAYGQEASQTSDPAWKVQLYRKADAISPTWNGLPNLPVAEFDAGDDTSAARDAHRLLDSANAPPIYTHTGHTVLGRIALAHGDVAEAKAELLASVPLVPAGGIYLEPNRTLAQDLVDHGERDVVIQFLEQFREFWRNDQGAIDHYIKVIKAPGTHDIIARYTAGQELRGRPAPKLPIDDYSGKIVAVQFRNAACKTCAEDFATVEKMAKIAADRDVTEAAIEQTGHEALLRQYEVDSFPTWVLIDREGRIADYMLGRVNAQDFERRIDQISSRPGVSQKLPAPVPVETQTAGTLAWSPVPGAESYVVQLDQRDGKGWVSDRDEHLVRVIPSHETSVALDPSIGETASPMIRWRVFAVSRVGGGIMSDWREIALPRP
jgi:hypothetical protein